MAMAHEGGREHGCTGQETNKRGILFCCGTVVALRARRNNEGTPYSGARHTATSPVDARMGFSLLFIYLYYIMTAKRQKLLRTGTSAAVAALRLQGPKAPCPAPE